MDFHADETQRNEMKRNDISMLVRHRYPNITWNNEIDLGGGSGTDLNGCDNEQ